MPLFGEEVVVGGQAVVGVDEGRGDVAIAGVSVVGRNHSGVFRIGVAGNGGLFESEAELDRGGDFEDADFGSRQQGFELFDVGVEPVFAELGENPFGGLLRLRGAGEVGLAGEALDEFADAGGVGNGAGLLFPADFQRLRCGVEAADGMFKASSAAGWSARGQAKARAAHAVRNFILNSV